MSRPQNVPDMRVLIVDDDRLTRSILTGLLKRLGHETIAAADGLAAVALLKEAPVEVVISDWMMPGMNGVELCRWVRMSPIVITEIAAS